MRKREEGEEEREKETGREREREQYITHLINSIQYKYFVAIATNI